MFNKKGFTLVELLVVISIMGILASVAIVNVSSARVKARDDKRKIDIDTVAQSLELYYSQYKKYPCSTCMTFTSTNWTTLKLLLSGYISTWPTDPPKYVYTVNSTAKKYVVDATLEKVDTNATVGNYCNSSPQNSDPLFWQSGVFKCLDNTYHYRRASQ